MEGILGRTLGSSQESGFCMCACTIPCVKCIELSVWCTVKEEFYSLAFHESPDQLQRGLDRHVEFYNRERAHQGYRTQGRTPLQTFSEGVAQIRKEVKPEAA